MKMLGELLQRGEFLRLSSKLIRKNGSLKFWWVRSCGVRRAAAFEGSCGDGGELSLSPKNFFAFIIPWIIITLQNNSEKIEFSFQFIFIVSTLYYYRVLELSNKSETSTCYKSFNRDSHIYFMLVYCPSISEFPTEIIKAWVILSGILSTNTVYTAWCDIRLICVIACIKCDRIRVRGDIFAGYQFWGYIIIM